MKRDFRLELPEVDPQALLDDAPARERYEAAVRDAVRHESGWEVLSDAVLGQFSFQELAMDDDGRHAIKLAEHVYCRRIAGDDSTPPSFAVAIPSPARFDAQVHPSKLHTILPCDSSQPFFTRPSRRSSWRTESAFREPGGRCDSVQRLSSGHRWL